MMIDSGPFILLFAVAVILALLSAIGCVAFGWPWVVVPLVAIASIVVVPAILAFLFFALWIASGSH